MLRHVAILLAVAGIAAGAAARVSATTVPGQVYVIKVTLTNTAITIQRDKFSLHSPYPRYPRGALIRYAVTNKGTKPLVLQMWGSKTSTIKPGAHDSFEINWSYRGTFVYRTLSNGKPVGPHGHVTIF